MIGTAQYTKEQLVEKFLKIEKSLGRIPKTIEFTKVGLPDVGFYNRAFGNFTAFLRHLGREVEDYKYRKKTNPKRFFYPSEWLQLINIINNSKHRIWLELMLHTGMRIDELRNTKILDIDLDRELIVVNKAKGGRGKERTIQISTYLKNRIATYAKENDLSRPDTFSFPSTPGMNKIIKRYAKDLGLSDWEDFSCHTTRKTLEMWLIALDVNTMAITSHMGHTVNVAQAFYVSSSLFKADDKSLARNILDNLLNK